MRTNIEIDDELVAEAMALFGLETKKATVEEALRMALRQARQRQSIRNLIGVGWDGDLDAMREGRFFEPPS
jgi:Arc/MetJ family transcription regulator